MAFDRAKVSLQQVEEKLRKFLGLAGNIGATFDPNVTPTLSIGSTDDPGYASFRGRKFIWISNTMLASSPANGVIGVRFAVPVILRGLMVAGITAGAGNPYVSAHLLTPDVVPLTLATNAGSWCDQKASQVDVPPLYSTAAGAMTVATNLPALAQCDVTNRVATWIATTGGMSDQWQYTNMHLGADSAIYWPTTTLVAGNIQFAFGVYGQIF